MNNDDIAVGDPTPEIDRPDDLVEPIRNGDCKVWSGDCFENIAYDHGHLWMTLWNAPENAPFKDTLGIPER